MTRPHILLPLTLLLACTGPGDGGASDTDTSTGTGTGTGTTAQSPTSSGTTAAAAGGTVRLTFTISPGARENLKPELPPKGTIHGSIFLAEDVGATGPVDGAESADDVTLAVDLTMADVSAESFTSAEIPPGQYVFLGFFDLNGNGDSVSEPESGEPATLPTVNKFTIEADKQIDYTVAFDLVL